MSRDEIRNMIEFMNASIQKFSIDPDRSHVSWHKILGKYSRNEAFEAIEYFMSYTDRAPTPDGLKGYIDRKRREAKQTEENLRGDAWQRKANESFNGVPGKNRAEQIIFVVGERAAEHYKRGETDNDYLNDRILDAKRCGFDFGINTEKLEHTGTSFFG